MWRIYNKDQDPSLPSVTPLFLMHGFMDEGTTWFFAEKQKNLLFNLLKTNKYDIWIANSRETRNTKGHKYFSQLQKEYWNFTNYEMATIDMPAMIDYVIQKTGKPKVAYMGHSQGTLLFFTASSILGDKFTSKIK